MSTEWPDTRRPCLERHVDERGYLARRFKRDELGNRPMRWGTAERTVLEIGVSLRVVMVLMLMMRRHGAGIGRTQFQQERRAARGHVSHGNIRMKQQRGQQQDGQHIGSPGVIGTRMHVMGATISKVTSYSHSEFPRHRKAHHDGFQRMFVHVGAAIRVSGQLILQSVDVPKLRCRRMGIE